MKAPLIRLEQVDVLLNGRTVLRNLDWQLHPGQHWAIVGGNGAGKSTFLKLLRGDLWPAPHRGRRIYRFDGKDQTDAAGIREKIGLVSPELQDRYLEQDWLLTGRQVVETGFFNTDYLYQKTTSRQKRRTASIIGMLDIGHLMRRNVQQLSTGELRKILIARALAGEPRLLLLDEVCDGLDARWRGRLLQMIEKVARRGTQILYTTHRAAETIPAITHELILEEGRIVSCGSIHSSASVVPLPLEPAAKPSALATPGLRRGARILPALIRIKAVNVFLDRKQVLRDIDWVLRADQNWAIFGPNGAGKSTLLKLIFGDLHPVAGGIVQHFGLPGNRTIWELKQRIGYVSPDFQSSYRAPLTGEEVIASGFFSSVGLPKRITSRQWRKARQLLRSFCLDPLAGKLISQMAYGEARAILTLRALVNDPQVLLLDEPFDGLDREAKADFNQTLEHVSASGTRLIMVTHHTQDLPECITHGLLLEKGRIRYQGELAQVHAHPAMQHLFNSICVPSRPFTV